MKYFRYLEDRLKIKNKKENILIRTVLNLLMMSKVEEI